MSHLTQISFNNFRVFDKKTTFDLAPITFLTGPNSSGKSSVLKGLLLLKSNYSSNLQVLDFSGPKHNLGTFENTLNKQQKSDCLTIGLQTQLGTSTGNQSSRGSFYRQSVTTRRSVYSVLREFDIIEKIAISTELTYQRNDRSGKLIKVEFFSKNETVSFMRLEIGSSDINSTHNLFIDSEKIAKDKFLRQMFHEPMGMFEAKFSGKDKIKTYNHSTIFAPKENVKERYIDDPITVFSKLYEKYVLDNFEFTKRREIHPYFVTLPFRKIMSDFSEVTDNVEYLEAVRANTKRIYTNDSQGTSFNELILEYRSRDIPEESLEFTNKWLKKLEIADELIFDNIEGVATSIFLRKGKEKVALADLGYGITQFLPILLKIALEVPIRSIGENDLVVVKKTILLEEPETNLHPKLQSLIADLLLDAIKTFEIRFVIETHSEYIVRKMQILTAEKKMKQLDCLIYYFNEIKDHQQQKVKRIEIKPNGALTDEFGDGFFDEATNLKLELLKKKENK